jgi:hypothetical protein
MNRTAPKIDTKETDKHKEAQNKQEDAEKLLKQINEDPKKGFELSTSCTVKDCLEFLNQKITIAKQIIK